MVREIGEVKEKIVVHELVSEVRRGMRNLSTVGGIRYMAQFPFSVVKTVFKRRSKPHI